MILGKLNESDGFALIMLAVITCSFGILILLFVTMILKARKRDREVDDLLHGVNRDEERKEPDRLQELQDSEPWSRDADWWKDRDKDS